MSRQTAAPANEVHLTGRVSGEPTERELPSGDRLVQLRVVVPRPARRARSRDSAEAAGGARRQVDTIDVACWTARTRAGALRLTDGSGVQVEGALRRRFFRTGAGAASRYEVEARALRSVELAG
jgi:single-strand DNA-binding protein